VPIGDTGYDVGLQIGPDEVTVSAGPSGADTVTTVDPIAPEEDPEPLPRDVPVTIAPPPPAPTFEDEPEGGEGTTAEARPARRLAP
jgi:hypothetical protein